MIKYLLRRTILTLLVFFIVGCTSERVIVVPSVEPDFHRFQVQHLAQLNLQPPTFKLLKNTALVVFDSDKCPIGVVDFVDNCPGDLGARGAICRGVPGNSRGVAEIARFSSGAQGEKFGIEFELLHPCSQPADQLKKPNATIKVCTMVGTAGKVWQIIKYDVIGTSNCSDASRRVLDPYLILVR